MVRPIAKHCTSCSRIKNNCKIFGITIEEYFDMLKKQDGRCAICKIEKCATNRNFAIDHDHKTGAIRGLLCCGCNIQLGWYEAKKEEIEKYLY